MRIVIPGDPIAKTRPRFCNRGKFTTTYDSQYMEKIHTRLLIAQEAGNHLILSMPYKVDLIFAMDAQKGSSKAECNVKLWGYSYPLKKDLDNMEKFILDCGNGILWPDDRYIVQLSSKKIYSKNPCTIIEINTINEVKMSAEYEKVFKIFSPEDVEAMSADAERIYMSIPPDPLHDIELYESQLAASAQLLINFANEWADKIKKIKK